MATRPEPSWPAQLRLLGRFAFRLRGFLRRPLAPADCRERVRQGLERRQENFLRVLERGVFAAPASSPYRQLFAHAGATLDDVRHAVRTRGLEPALRTLADAGVHLRLDEFKGRRPIRRGSLHLEATPHDFDNPLSGRDLASQTGGSRTGRGGTRIYIDLDSYAQDAAYQHHMLAAFDLLGHPSALWCPVPPYSSGINEVFRSAKLGRPPERWFAQDRASYTGRAWRHALLAGYLIRAGRFHGAELPRPEHVPLAEARRVAAWLATKRAAGTPAVLKTNVATGVRVCLAAQENGLDIAGTAFRLDSEPLTPARAAIFGQAGCLAVNTYAMSEAGWIGVPCARPAAADEVHLLSDKVALVRHEVAAAPGEAVRANFYTTLLPTTPKLMINVECGDYSAVTDRSCGCPFEELGYAVHLHTVRSYDKLTSEGMNFLASDLHRLVEEVLPARFGGSPLDYQLVERDEGGLPKVDVLVSPRLGGVGEAEVVAAVVGFLNAAPNASGDFGERWRDARALRLVRREPFATGAGKVLALHVLEPGIKAAPDGARP
jgi:hypothetical protein